MSKVFDLGKIEAQNGIKITQNPYVRGSKEYQAWAAGWNEQRYLTKKESQK